MHRNTTTAIRRLAKIERMSIDRLDDDCVEMSDGVAVDLCAHRHRGGWLAAWRYEGGWRSSDMPADFKRVNQGYSYTVANTLRGLVAQGVRVHKSPLGALRAMLPD